MTDNRQGTPARKALLYALLAGLWIIFSDWFLARFIGEAASSTLLQTFKGWLFVFVTAVILYLLLRHELSKLHEEIAVRRSVEEALRESEARLVRAQQVAKMGDFTWDLETNEITWSHGMYDLLGYSHSDTIDYNLVTSNVHHPEDRDRIAEWLQAALTAESTVLPMYEYRIVRKDGHAIHIRNQGIIERRAEKKPRIFATIVDITEHVTNDREREQLQSQIVQAQKMESVGRLAGGVAHDFNNILSVIIGYTEIALLKVAKDDPLHEDLTEVLNAARRSTDITRQLLTFARKQSVSPQVLDLNDSIAGMLKMLQRLIGEDIEVIWRPGKGMARVRIDPSQVDQLLANLCINARDAISGVGTVIIETGMAALDDAFCAAHTGYSPGDYVTLTVSDNGSGIDQETMKYLFEPFYTTKEEGKGTGLGLATVFGIIQQNNGFIHVSSEPGHGATFSIYLPACEGAATRQDPRHATSNDLGGTETILVVEDAEAMLKLASRMLSQLGYSVLTAHNPAEAIALVDRQDTPIDLLLTDVIMPGMNGQELAELLKKRHPAMKILFMSGHPADVIAERGILKQGVHFIAKPFSRPALSQKIRETLRADSKEG